MDVFWIILILAGVNQLSQILIQNYRIFFKFSYS